MIFHAFCRVLLAAALLLITSVKASPFYLDSRSLFELSPRDTVVTHQCSDLVVGSTRLPDIGTVCADLTGGKLIITYTITNSAWTFNKVHALVLSSAPASNFDPGPPGGFPYTSDNGICKISGNVATCTISPIPSAWRGCTGSLYIFAHADVTGPDPSNPTTNVQQTAWDNGPCSPAGTKGNCAKYFTVNKQCDCPVIYSVPPTTTTTTSTSIFPVTSTSSYLTSTTIEFLTSTTVQFLTSTTIVYTTSTTSEYTTSTTSEYTTSTTSEYSTATIITSTTTSVATLTCSTTFPLTTTTTTCNDPNAPTITPVIATTNNFVLIC